jgi:hypothetical protein
MGVYEFSLLWLFSLEFDLGGEVGFRGGGYFGC